MEVWNSIAKEAKGEIDRIIPIIGHHWSINLWTETNRTSEDAISTQFHNGSTQVESLAILP